jgi:hypothetical protein
MAIVAAALTVVLAIGSAWRPVAAQATRSDDVLPALLTEVKGLRAAMEQMASSSTQAQLLVGRLQLQEGRIASMIRRLDTVRDSLATARREYTQIQGSMQMLGTGEPGGVPPQDRDDLLAGLKIQVATSKANVDRLAAEEMQLTADIATEQARWVDINQRLDELERSLARR